jgi:UDP-N-acetylglucosamine/UDP-N-acetylgalactosamine diphosphorylase
MGSVSSAIEALHGAGQPDLAAALESLEGDAQERLAAQVAALDLSLISELVEQFVVGDGEEGPLGDITEAATIPIPADAQTEADEAAAREAGEELLRLGKVAAVLLAGGQGSRLGFDGPKGDYPFAPITGRTLFSHHAAKIAALRTRYGCDLPWYILTSPQNDEATKASFAAEDHFGLDPTSIRFVVQGTLPAVDAANGALLRAAPDRLALSPDGHGGLFSALRASGSLDEMQAGGITTIFTFQVDNPKVRVCRPEFLGYHSLAGAEMSNTAVRKRTPDEKMGVVVRIDGTPGLVEYSDMPAELAAQCNDDGSLTYWAGSIAVHCIDVGFAMRITEGRLQLPYHRADKKVAHVGADGELVEPTEPNAIKFETFLFDGLRSATGSITIEAAREDEFSPIKNAEGDSSPESARVLLNEMYSRWFAAAGVEVPADADGAPVNLEIDPRFALDARELAAKLPEGFTIDGPVAIGPPGPTS